MRWEMDYNEVTSESGKLQHTQHVQRNILKSRPISKNKTRKAMVRGTKKSEIVILFLRFHHLMTDEFLRTLVASL